jgi:hypothetical protein
LDSSEKTVWKEREKRVSKQASGDTQRQKDFLKFIIIEPNNFQPVVLHINQFLDKPHPVLIIPLNISILCFDITILAVQMQKAIDEMCILISERLLKIIFLDLL